MTSKNPHVTLCLLVHFLSYHIVGKTLYHCEPQLSWKIVAAILSKLFFGDIVMIQVSHFVLYVISIFW